MFKLGYLIVCLHIKLNNLTKTQLKNDLVLEKQLEDLIIPLNKEEFSQLESNILKEGCREALIAWKKEKKLILIDGHNRYKICCKHSIPFKVRELRFENIEEAKIWMLNNQLGRRNLNPDQMSYYRGLKYLGLKRKKGGYENVQSKGQNEPSTAESLSQEFNVSESTIKRDAKYAEGLEIITKSNPTLKNDILNGETKLKKSDVALLTQSEDGQNIKFKNAADLHNKLDVIKDSVFNDIENSLNEIEEKRVKAAQALLKESEPIFQSKDDRIQNIKGRIISMMNKAIRNKDLTALGDMKKLIDKLEYLISSD